MFPPSNVQTYCTPSLFSLRNHFFPSVWDDRLATDSLGGQRVNISSLALSVWGAWEELSHISKTTWLLLNHLSWRLLIVSFMKEDARLEDVCSLLSVECVFQWGRGQTAERSAKFKKFKPSDVVTNDETNSLSPTPQNQRRPCNLSTHCYFECANGNTFLSLGRVSVRGDIQGPQQTTA